MPIVCQPENIAVEKIDPLTQIGVAPKLLYEKKKKKK